MPQNDQNLVAATPICHLSNNYYSSFFNNLKVLYNDERFYDVELHCADSEKCTELGTEINVIKAHRIILSSSSNYFFAMFGNDFNENKNKIVKFHSISYDILKVLINFIYTGKIEITQVNVQELLAGELKISFNYNHFNNLSRSCGFFATK